MQHWPEKMSTVTWGRDVQWRSHQNKLLLLKIRLQNGLSTPQALSCTSKRQEPFRNEMKEVRFLKKYLLYIPYVKRGW